jgi:hypothetical protein
VCVIEEVFGKSFSMFVLLFANFSGDRRCLVMLAETVYPCERKNVSSMLFAHRLQDGAICFAHGLSQKVSLPPFL